MFEIELDIFSGRPNPRWTLDADEGEEFLTRLLDRTVPIAPLRSSEGLGYRGFICTATGNTAAVLHARHLPTTFRVRDGLAQSIDSSAETWLRFSGHTVAVPGAADGVIGQGISTTALEDATAVVKRKLFFTSSTDFSEWNGSHEIFNNCYNYASNSITDTFAQPGRGSGEMYHDITADEIHKAALRDGYLDGLHQSTKKRNLHVGYCIWPGSDYHWYRQTEPMDGEIRWTHKPGGTPARNYDSSGKFITDPSTCDRGPYTIWGGFMYNPGKQNKVAR
jgi:hypothetical protein